MHLPGNTPKLEETDLLYNNALNDFLAAGYLDATGDVHFEYGRLLLDYGYPIGLDFLHKSIIYYKETSETGNRQAAWKKISDWHHRHGNDDEAKIAEQESLSLDRQVEFKLNKAVQSVMEIHTAFIQQREGLAVELGEKYLAEHKASRMAPQIRALLANALSQGTRKALAVEHLRSIIDYYAPSAPSSFLSEAWFNYANAIFFTDPGNGVKAIETAIEMAEALHDDLGVAKYARELAVNISNNSVLARKFPEEKRVTELFNKAYAALDRSNTFLSAVERLNTLEKQRLCCSQVKDSVKALQYFHEAGSMASRLGLKINQAFSQTYTGLTLLQFARDRQNAGIFKEAALRFSYASLLFSSISYYRFSWRSKHLQGQVYQELAADTPAGGEREQYWIEADLAFAEAADMIDYLKGLSSGGGEMLSGVVYQANRDFPIDFSQVFNAAFLMNFRLRQNYPLAFSWAERNKSRQLQAMLSKAGAPAKTLLTNKLPSFQDIRTLLYDFGESWLTSRKIMLCEYYIVDNQIILFLVRPEWDAPQVHVLSVPSSELYKTVDYLFFQGTESLLDKLNDGLETEWSACSWLIADVLKASLPDEILYIIPHTYLHQLPFHALSDGQGGYLIERNPVVYAPSAAVLFQIAVNGRKQGQKPFLAGQAAVFGDSRNNLPQARSEALAIGALLSVEPVIGNAVTQELFTANLKNAVMLHFAGHAVANVKDGLSQYILLEGQETFTALQLMNSPNNLELLVLSGCETGTGEVQQNIDELVGLPAAALLSGTKTVLTTLWKVNDQSTKQFFDYFYQAFEGQQLPKVIALQLAIKQMIANDRYSFFHWAPFTLTGNYI